MFGEHPEWYTEYGLAGHNGIDYAVPAGTAVHAAAEGRVAKIAHEAGGYGLYVTLAHEAGQTIYAHLGEAQCRVGQVVKVGDVIALSGFSGNVKPAGEAGAHLHFTYRMPPFTGAYKGAVNPEPLFAAAGSRTRQATALVGLNVRNGPGVQNAAVGRLTAGESVTVTEAWVRTAAGTWVAAYYDGEELLTWK